MGERPDRPPRAHREDQGAASPPAEDGERVPSVPRRRVRPAAQHHAGVPVQGGLQVPAELRRDSQGVPARALRRAARGVLLRPGCGAHRGEGGARGAAAPGAVQEALGGHARAGGAGAAAGEGGRAAHRRGAGSGDAGSHTPTGRQGSGGEGAQEAGGARAPPLQEVGGDRAGRAGEPVQAGSPRGAPRAGAAAQAAGAQAGDPAPVAGGDLFRDALPRVRALDEGVLRAPHGHQQRRHGVDPDARPDGARLRVRSAEQEPEARAALLERRLVRGDCAGTAQVHLLDARLLHVAEPEHGVGRVLVRHQRGFVPGAARVPLGGQGGVRLLVGLPARRAAALRRVHHLGAVGHPAAGLHLCPQDGDGKERLLAPGNGASDGERADTGGGVSAISGAQDQEQGAPRKPEESRRVQTLCRGEGGEGGRGGGEGRSRKERKARRHRAEKGGKVLRHVRGVGERV